MNKSEKQEIAEIVRVVENYGGKFTYFSTGMRLPQEIEDASFDDKGYLSLHWYTKSDATRANLFLEYLRKGETKINPIALEDKIDTAIADFEEGTRFITQVLLGFNYKEMVVMGFNDNQLKKRAEIFLSMEKLAKKYDWTIHDSEKEWLISEYDWKKYINKK